jgi:peptidoglycan/xylan/chitin deacetylase (PgdA/CDA1 family)
MKNLLQLLGIKTLPVRKGRASHKYVSLTFDDGPDPFFTPSILDILKETGVKATFFLVGQKASQHPEIARRIVAEGHGIGNHTYSHLHPYRISSFRATEDMRAGKNIIESITGIPVRFFRPPHGAIRPCILKASHQLNQQIILWSISGHDWGRKSTCKTIDHRIMNRLHKGGIILLHDAPSEMNRPAETSQALPSMIHHIQEKGYDIVDLCKLMSNDRRSPTNHEKRQSNG